ncbi:MAG: thioesterase family protein [Bacteroidales bacterium]
MVINDSKVRVRYGETDKMGYCYYGIYAQYFEIGRTDLMRKFGLSYRETEERGIMLPVLTLNVKYTKPALYDDELTIRTFLTKLPSVRIEFLYEIYNQNNELLTTAETTLVFIDSTSRRPIKAPDDFIDKLAPFF